MPIDALTVLNSLVDFSFGNPLVQAALLGIVRGIAGWAQHTLEDGKITWPELQELGATILRFLPQSIGLSALGFPAAGALFTDLFVTKLAKIADAKKK